MKKKILLVNEASFLNTGFSNYGRKLLSELHKTGKYEIGEFGSYAHQHDNRAKKLPWKFYGNLPVNPQEEQIYNSWYSNQFGEWKFEDVLLDFRPQIVLAIRDHYFDDFILRSIYRDKFKFVWMACVDSEPLQPNWVNNYLQCDAVTGYTQWGVNSVKNHCGKCDVKFYDYVGACPDLEIFKPIPNKIEHKVNLGILPDAKIVGTIMRNQPRKMFPDIFYSFRKFLESAPTNVANKTFLYVHSTYPDVGWVFPDLLQTYKIGHKVLFTYICQNCQYVFPSFFRDALAVCPRCQQLSAHFPNSNHGVTREALAQIYNLFDLYLQVSIAGALEIPHIEAASCGVPSIGTDATATAEINRRIGSWPLKVKRYFLERDTGCYRAYSDTNHLAELLRKFFNLTDGHQQLLGKQCREGVLQSYNFDRASLIWQSILDEMEVYDDDQSWNSPVKFHRPNLNIPGNLRNTDFVRWIISNIAGAPEKAYSPLASSMIRNLNLGTDIYAPAQMRRAVSRESMVQEMIAYANKNNHYEKLRYMQNSGVQVKKQPLYNLA